MTKVIGISGGTGFCGKEIIKRSVQKNIKVVSYQRSKKKNGDYTVSEFNLENVSKIDVSLLDGVDTFVHGAALVHKKEKSTKYQALNFLATKKLFQMCAEAGVKKFIFFSTVGVYGLTSATKTVNIKSELAPKNPYSKSKLDAEKFLVENSSLYGVDVLILRLPLVFGEEAPGNLGFLKKIINWQVPLPFMGIDNKRSIISVETLADIVTDYVLDKIKWQGVELITDPQPLSTESIVSKLKKNSRDPNFLFFVPKKIMKIIFIIFRKRKVYEKLFEDLVFESSQDVLEFVEKELK